MLSSIGLPVLPLWAFPMPSKQTMELPTPRSESVTSCSNGVCLTTRAFPTLPTGQAIVECAHRTLKTMLEKQKKRELGCPHDRLAKALYILSFLNQAEIWQTAHERQSVFLWHKGSSETSSNGEGLTNWTMEGTSGHANMGKGLCPHLHRPPHGVGSIMVCVTFCCTVLIPCVHVLMFADISWVVQNEQEVFRCKNFFYLLLVFVAFFFLFLN